MGEADSSTNIWSARLSLLNAYQKNNCIHFLEDMIAELVEEVLKYFRRELNGPPVRLNGKYGRWWWANLYNFVYLRRSTL